MLGGLQPEASASSKGWAVKRSEGDHWEVVINAITWLTVVPVKPSSRIRNRTHKLLVSRKITHKSDKHLHKDLAKSALLAQCVPTNADRELPNTW